MPNIASQPIEKGRAIVITTGMTGGHFFPALSFAEACGAKYPDLAVHFLLPKKNERFDLSRHEGRIQFHHLPVGPFPRTFGLKLFSFLIHYLRSLAQTWKFLASVRPKFLASFGSYGSFPGVVCAWTLGIPVILHEQNRIAGRANRLAAFFSRWVAVSFPDTKGILLKGKIKWVGYPLRHEIIQAACEKQARPEGKSIRTILVLGGSQGSEAINEAVLAVFEKLSAEEKQKLAVIHITGEAQFSEVSERYRISGVLCKVFAFSDEMHEWYREADLVVARSGAGTVFELLEFGLPAVLIPYPFAHAHQTLNAQYLEENGLAVVIEQKSLTPERLRKAIDQIMSRLAEGMKKARPKLVRSPNQIFIQLVDQLIQR